MKTALRAITLVFFALALTPAEAQETPDPGVLNIQGVGEVSAEPDIAYVTSGVVAEGKTAKEALDKNTEAMSALVSILKGAAIDDKDIQTAGFSVEPVYVYSDKRGPDGYQQQPRIEGYRVMNNVTVRVRNIAGLGSILDDMVTVGANTINSISFSVDDTSELLNEARRKAMADALAKAGLYADAAGVGLGRILSISENGGFNPQPKTMARMDMVAAESAPVPIQSGEVSYSVSVSVQWELSQ